MMALMTNIFLLGEAYGEEEEKQRAPFMGAAGYELTKMLGDAGIHRADCYITNVFNLRPKGNRMEDLCGPSNLRLDGWPSLMPGKYIRKEFAPELERLSNELLEINPNVVVALGNTACWALLGKTAISKLRGVTQLSTHCVSGFKVLPTYHPASLFKGADQWANRPIIIMDLVKAKRESLTGEILRPYREIWIEPTLEDINEFHSYITSCQILSVDIETAGREITCTGFAPSRSRAIVIPFTCPGRLGRNYWPTGDIELRVWEYVRGVLENPGIPKVFQNGMYDIAFLYRGYGIKVANAKEDTMLLHHALQPESLKGLGFLGSLYCDEGAWKQMRQRKQTIKRDD
jgi:uracil-DNA glycosylase